ncbi:hypothetical protein TH53_23320 [Pedobacter lusitanus]|uniref:Glycosyl transferase family 1 domain-containing protein n=1 Tax=Pedobacter lusitanus TaxID=1503925 RepID=A0A0D0F033_9SPHI|nr:glycosyltransferase [Pedobacter lusitanus]KIO74983.1 hypothetical protein TH53_23320 [Pedobacter lusitanus]
MNIKRSISKKVNKLFGTGRVKSDQAPIYNLYQTTYERSVLICYITHPFYKANHFTHQNYITSHIIAESFSELGYNVDIISYLDKTTEIDYGKYAVIFGMGYRFEDSFYHADRNIPRIMFVTGAHEHLHNEMCLRSINDFHRLSGLWLANETNMISVSTYFSLFNADFAIILARGFVYEDYKSRFVNHLYSLNNNILGSFSEFKPKTAESRTKSFLFLTGAKLVTKGLHILLEVAKLRTDLNFYIVVPHMDIHFENYYEQILHHTPHVFLYKNIRMDSVEMRHIIENCSYTIASSYVDGLPGGTIEPMSAGLIPIVSKYCGFAREKFIFEMEELSSEGLNQTIEKVLALDDRTYAEYCTQVRTYTINKFSAASVKADLLELLQKELKAV